MPHKVTIQEALEQVSGSGARDTVYRDWLVNIWAEVLPLTTRETWQAQQVAATSTHRIRIRYRPGITARHRVKWTRAGGSPTDAQYFDLDGDPLDQKGRRIELHLICTAREAEGFRSGPPYEDSAPLPGIVTADSTTVTADQDTWRADSG